MTDEDQIISAGEPYFRVVQPKSGTAAFAASSYFRLGSYVTQNDEEKGLVTGLKTTTSSVSEGDKGAFEQAGDAIENDKGDPAKKFNATSQAATSYSTTASKGIDATNNGILLYTDGELQENIAGAALQKYGKGHVTEIATADASYKVVGGKYDVFAQNGVFIKAGSKAAPSNIELTAEGYIKQTAYGDLDEVTYGITHKRFHGIANDMFMGLKFTFFFGLESTVKLAGSLTIIMSLEAVFRISARFQLTLAADANFVFGVASNFFTGAKTDVITGVDSKTVFGTSTKTVVGPDIKTAVSDMKILATTDIKSAPVGDMKKVGINMTISDYNFSQEFAAMANNTGMAAIKAELKVKFDKLWAGNTSGASMDMSGIKLFA